MAAMTLPMVPPSSGYGTLDRHARPESSVARTTCRARHQSLKLSDRCLPGLNAVHSIQDRLENTMGVVGAVRKAVEVLGVDAVGSVDFAVQAGGAGLDVGVAEAGLELGHQD